MQLYSSGTKCFIFPWRPHNAYVVVTMKIVFSTLIIMYFLAPVVVRLNPWIAKEAIFLNRRQLYFRLTAELQIHILLAVRWPPSVNLSDPGQLGMNQTISFWIQSEEQIGAWLARKWCCCFWLMMLWSLFSGTLFLRTSKLKMPANTPNLCQMVLPLSCICMGMPEHGKWWEFFHLVIWAGFLCRAGWHRMQLYQVLSETGFHVISIDYRGGQWRILNNHRCRGFDVRLWGFPWVSFWGRRVCWCNGCLQVDSEATREVTSLPLGSLSGIWVRSTGQGCVLFLKGDCSRLLVRSVLKMIIIDGFKLFYWMGVFTLDWRAETVRQFGHNYYVYLRTIICFVRCIPSFEDLCHPQQLKLFVYLLLISLQTGVFWTLFFYASRVAAKVAKKISSEGLYQSPNRRTFCVFQWFIYVFLGLPLTGVILEAPFNNIKSIASEHPLAKVSIRFPISFQQFWLSGLSLRHTKE